MAESPRAKPRKALSQSSSSSMVPSSGRLWRSRSPCVSPKTSRSLPILRSAQSLPTLPSSALSSDFHVPAVNNSLLQRRLREWDSVSIFEAVPQRRAKLLQYFIDRCSGFTARELDRDFNEAASLFLARLTSWFRLTYRLPKTYVQLQLSALGVFLGATGGSKFALEFTEVGGCLVLVDILRTHSLAVGFSAVLNVLEQSSAIDIEEQGKELLVYLGTGTQHIVKDLLALLKEMGSNFRASHAFILRQLLMVPAAEPLENFEIVLTLLSSTDFELQSEGQQLLMVILRFRPCLLPQITTALFEMLGNHSSIMDDSFLLHVVDCTTAAATKALNLILTQHPCIKEDILRNNVHLIATKNLACMTLQLVRTESAALLRQLFEDTSIQTEIAVVAGSDIVNSVLFESELVRRGFSKRIRQRLNSISIRSHLHEMKSH
eukprot:gene2546-5466_t